MNKPLISSLLIIIALLIVLTFSLCTKGEKLYTAEATLYNSGSPASDGCGWFFRIDTTKEYSATNLSNDFKLHNSRVIIRYRLLDTKFECGWGAKLQQIELVDIKLKDAEQAKTDATIVDMGSPQADGCGWMVKIDTTYYSPETSLPTKYQKANLKVKIAYDLLNTKYQCGIAANLKYTQINIKAIRER
jgi:hypothetical protein